MTDSLRTRFKGLEEKFRSKAADLRALAQVSASEFPYASALEDGEATALKYAADQIRRILEGGSP